MPELFKKQPYYLTGCDKADGAHQGAAHVVGLRAKDILDPDPPNSQTYGFGPVALLGLLGQRLAPLALAVNVAFELPGAQRCLPLTLRQYLPCRQVSRNFSRCPRLIGLCQTVNAPSRRPLRTG